MTYKKKLNFLLIGGLLIAFIAYRFAISNTISVYYEYKKLKNKQELVIHLPQKIASLKAEIAYLDKAINTHQQADLTTEQNILDLVTDYCKEKNIVLREFPKTVGYKEKDYLIETNIFTVDGSFSKLLNLVYLLEQKRKAGKVVSLKFFSKKDNKTQVTSLFLTIYLQNIKKNETHHN